MEAWQISEEEAAELKQQTQAARQGLGQWDGHPRLGVWMLMIKSLTRQALVPAGPPTAPLTAHSLLLYETEH